MRKEIRIPGPDHAITIAPTAQHVTVHVGEHAIAESDTALTLSEAGYAPVQYVPIGDVDTTSIEPSGTETYCPYKGDATYYSISLPDTKIKDAIWTYVSPYESVKEIAGYVAFYDGKDGITVDLHLGQQHLDRLDALSRPTLGFPADVMREASVVSGSTAPNYPTSTTPSTGRERHHHHPASAQSGSEPGAGDLLRGHDEAGLPRSPDPSEHATDRGREAAP